MEEEAGKEREKRKQASRESGLWEFFKSTPPFRDFDQVDGDYRC